MFRMNQRRRHPDRDPHPQSGRHSGTHDTRPDGQCSVVALVGHRHARTTDRPETTTHTQQPDTAAVNKNGNKTPPPPEMNGGSLRFD